MRGIVVVAALAPLAACGAAATQSGPARLSAKQVFQRASPAVVRVEAGRDKVGTGFVLDKDGVIATNLHVVAGESAIRVRLFDGTQYGVEQIAGVDPDRDLALLRIRPAKELPALRLGDSSALSAGDEIFAIGNPLGVFDYSVTEGLISQVRPYCGPADIAAQRCRQELTVLQFSAAISPGSSGGPLFNQAGEVVGVTTAIITAGQAINLAVPSNYLRPLLADRARVSIAPAEFARVTKLGDDPGGDKDGPAPRIVRRVPHHELSVFDGCQLADIAEVTRQIGEAIESGAPLYNEHKHEACFRIYEGTAVKFERDAACAGVRKAFGDGLLRASSLASYTEKAWALRDTFDGLLEASQRWLQRHPEQLKPGPVAPPPRS